jgi:hypothetical protein
MPRNKRTEFDDEEASDVSNFPTDITITGSGNPNLSVSDQQLVTEAQEHAHQKLSSPPAVSFFSPVSSVKRADNRRSFWDRLSPFEKRMLIVIGFLTCVIIILISVLAVQSNTTLQVHVSTQSNKCM